MQKRSANTLKWLSNAHVCWSFFEPNNWLKNVKLNFKNFETSQWFLQPSFSLTLFILQPMSISISLSPSIYTILLPLLFLLKPPIKAWQVIKRIRYFYILCKTNSKSMSCQFSNTSSSHWHWSSETPYPWEHCRNFWCRRVVGPPSQLQLWGYHWSRRQRGTCQRPAVLQMLKQGAANERKLGVREKQMREERLSEDGKEWPHPPLNLRPVVGSHGFPLVVFQTSSLLQALMHPQWA